MTPTPTADDRAALEARAVLALDAYLDACDEAGRRRADRPGPGDWASPEAQEKDRALRLAEDDCRRAYEVLRATLAAGGPARVDSIRHGKVARRDGINLSVGAASTGGRKRHGGSQ